MSDELDIEFGDVQETRLEQRLRPDCNKHFAVVGYENPGDNDLPIFVDIDVMRDMEAHALADTSVELGGVLLGGQFEDENGKPFVLVTDSLRAEHYESTKGSFKFTHDTWSKITRQRDEFPDDLQMVGWYHTHPDWGVFLSGMDMFICDNFFNRTLDVALVIDPCRKDRGWFMWTGNPSERVRRTGGFFLIASRHRREEVEFYSNLLEGKLPMAHDPRYGGFAGQASPVVNIAESRGSWQILAVLGMLTVQFLFVGLLAWKILMPETAAEEKESDSATKQIEQLASHVEQLTQARQRADDADAQLRVLDQVVTVLGEGQPRGLVKSLETLQLENQALRDKVRVLENLEKRVYQENQSLNVQLADAGDEQEFLESQIETLDEKIAGLKDQSDEDKKAIKGLEKDLKDYRIKAGDDPDAAWWARVDWKWLLAGALGGALATLGVVISVSNRQQQADHESFSEDAFEADPNTDDSPSDQTGDGKANG